VLSSTALGDRVDFHPGIGLSRSAASPDRECGVYKQAIRIAQKA
jgi:hypothetical protein